MEFVDPGVADAPALEKPFTDLRIDHARGTFAAFGPNGTGDLVSFGKELTVVMLGLIRQRILWPPRDHTGLTGGSRPKPLCQSSDAESGFVQDVQKFPWRDAGFTHMEQTQLACSSCDLRKWQDNKPPACNHVWNVPVITYHGVTQGDFQTYVIGFNRSALRELETYMTPFRDSGTPLYTECTTIKLARVERNGNRYSVPSFQSAGQRTDKRHYPEFSRRLHECREWLHTPPRQKAVHDNDLDAFNMG